jgi:hypothetical protein
MTPVSGSFYIEIFAPPANEAIMSESQNKTQRCLRYIMGCRRMHVDEYELSSLCVKGQPGCTELEVAGHATHRFYCFDSAMMMMAYWFKTIRVL